MALGSPPGLDGFTRSQVLAILEMERVKAEIDASHAPPQGLIEWTEQHRMIGDEPMVVHTLPWLRDLYLDMSPEIVIQKASQVYCSEYLLNTALWLADTGYGGRGNALYIFPKQRQMNDFVRARVDSAIEASPHLSKRVGVVPGTGEAAVDNVGLKRVGRGHCYFRGSDQRQQLLSVDADCVAGSTIIQTEDGPQTIRRLVKQSYLGRVLAFDHSVGRPVWARVKAGREIRDRDFVEVITASGKTIRCTPGHRVYVEGRGYGEAALLRRGDTLLISRPAGAPQDVRPLWNEQGGGWPRISVQRLLLGRASEIQRGAGGVDVRPMRRGVHTVGGVRAPGRQDGKGGALLLEEVCPTKAGFNQAEGCMRPLRHLEWRQGRRQVLFPQVPERSQTDTKREYGGALGVSAMRGRVPGGFIPAQVLYADVRVCRSLPANEGVGQLSLQGRGTVLGALSGDADTRLIPGSRRVRGLQSQGDLDRDAIPWGEGSPEVEFGSAPHQCEPARQSTGEPGYALCDVSRSLPQVEKDTVAVVRRIRGARESVYDLDVEGCRNFFADGVLVHNCVLMDELEEFSDGVPALARKRLASSRAPLTRAASTPKFPASGMARLFAGTTQRHYHIRCDGCGERQPLRFPANLTRSGELICHKCRGPLDPVSEGEWVAKHPDATVVGYHINRLYSPRADLPALADLGYAIEDGLISDQSAIQEFWNQDLGEPFAPEGGSLNDTVIDACERNYEHPSPIVGYPVVMGVDVGAVLHVVVKCRETGDDQDVTRMLYAGTTNDWGELDRLMQTWRVNRCIIDAMPEDGKAMAFARRWPGRAYVSFFPNMTRWSHAEPAVWKASEPVVLIHRTRALDDLFARLLQQKEHLPKGTGFIPGFRAQLKAPIRVISTDSDGRSVARYDEGSAADHFCFSLLLSSVAWNAVRGATGASSVEYSVVTGSGTTKATLAAPVKRIDETDEQFENRQTVHAAERSLLAARSKFATITANSRRNQRLTRAYR